MNCEIVKIQCRDSVANQLDFPPCDLYNWSLSEDYLLIQLRVFSDYRPSGRIDSIYRVASSI